MNDGEKSPIGSSNGMRRVLRLTGWVFAIFGSLLVFPAGISWLIAGWLGWMWIVALQDRSAWIPLACCLVLLLIKQAGWSVPMFLFFLVGSAMLIGLWKNRSPAIQFSLLMLLSGLGIGVAYLRWSDTNCSHQFHYDLNRPVVCLGDSLTDSGYPVDLKEMLVVPLVDFGRDGFTTVAAIKKLLPEIEALNPQVVIVELGGHDFKDGRTRAETKANLATIINRLAAIDAQVVLVEIPRGFISDPYRELERELCGEFDLQLIPDTLIRRFIYFSPIVPPGSWLGPADWLSADGLHPNAQGNQLFARYAAESLRKLYGDSIFAP